MRIVKKYLTKSYSYTHILRTKCCCNRNLCTTETKTWDYDIVVSGCGIVSTAFINSIFSLSKLSDFKVCIIDPIDKSNNSLSNLLSNMTVPSNRVYALSTGSIEFLQSINVWNQIKDSNRIQPYKQMYIYESFGPGVVSFDCKDVNVNQLGYIVEENVILQALIDSLEKYKINIDYKYGYVIDDINVNIIDNLTIGPANISITNINDKSKLNLSTRLLIGGDGAQSVVRKLSNISTINWSYGQDALITTVEIDSSNESSNIAFQKYLPTGPLAMLPLWNNYKSIVWSLPSSEAKRISKLNYNEIIDLLNNSLHNNNLSQNWDNVKPNNKIDKYIKEVANTFKILSDPPILPPKVISIVNKIQSFPLQFQHVTLYYSNRIALIGDAAHSIHPQAGQGLNLGLSDAKALSQVIHENIIVGNDIGDINILQKYHNKQYYNNLSMLLNVDMINTIYSENKLISPYLLKLSNANNNTNDSYNINNIKSIYYFLRSFGMLSINSFRFIKKYIIKYAMGA